MLRMYPAPFRVSSREARTAIRLAKKGEYPHPFVIAGLSSELFREEGVCSYQIILSPVQAEDVGLITGAEARQIIKANNMEKAGASEYGAIYETPARSFHRQWHGYFGTQDLAEVWKVITRDPGYPRNCDGEEVWAYYEGKALVICGPAPLVNFLQERLGKGDRYPASSALGSLRKTIKFQPIC